MPADTTIQGGGGGGGGERVARMPLRAQVSTGRTLKPESGHVRAGSDGVGNEKTLSEPN